jgi:glutamyl-tRNA reductase
VRSLDLSLPTMTLLSFSLSHHTARIGAREAAVSSLGDVRDWLLSLDRAVIAEAFVVSTCHRLEIYLVADDEEQAKAALIASLGPLETTFGDKETDWTLRQNGDAAVHLARVAAGLDSLIVGEAEIAGQVRRAAAIAREAGVFGPRLERVLAGALRASGRARSETRIAEGVMSAASAGVALATSVFGGSLAGRHVLVIGAGQAARTALGRLARRPIGSISVASRSPRHAEEAAAIANAGVWRLDDVAGRLGEIDVVIAATHGGHYLVTTEQCRMAYQGAPDRPRVFVDLSVPRVIDAGAASLPGVSLWSVDDLGDVARESLQRRQREVPLVEAIAREEGQRSFREMRARGSRRREG